MYNSNNNKNRQSANISCRDTSPALEGSRVAKAAPFVCMWFLHYFRAHHVRPVHWGDGTRARPPRPRLGKSTERHTGNR